MENFPKIAQVTPLSGKVLKVVFENGTTKRYDCRQLLQQIEFSLLKDDAFFKSVRVDTGGYGISWSDDIDISEYELWTNGVEADSLKRTPT